MIHNYIFDNYMQMHKLIVRVTNTLLQLFLFGGIALSVGVWKFQSSYIKIDGLHKTIEKKLPQISFENLYITWASIKSPPHAQLSKVHWSDGQTTLSAEKVIASISIFSLLYQHEPQINFIEIQSPHLATHINTPSKTSLDDKWISSSGVSHIKIAYPTLQNLLHQSLRKIPMGIYVHNGEVTLHHDQKAISIKELNVQLQSHDNSVATTFSGTLTLNNSPIYFGAQARLKPNLIGVSLKVNNFYVEDLKTFFPTHPVLQHYTAPFNYNGYFTLHPSPFKGALNGVISYQLPLAQVPLHVGHATYFAEEDGHLQIKGFAGFEQFTLSNLSEVWPLPLLATTESWISQNISEAQVPWALVNWEGYLDLTTSRLNITPTSQFQLEGASLSYAESFPKITNISAHAAHVGNTFTLNIQNGRTKNVHIPAGKILFSNLGTAQSKTEIDLKIDAPLAEALWLANHPPLKIKDTYKLPDDVQGNLSMDLHLSFPLGTDLQFKDIKTHFSATLQKATLPLKILNQPVPITNGNGTLSFKNKQLTLSASYILYGHPGSVHWQEHPTGDKKQSFAATFSMPLHNLLGFNLVFLRPYLQEGAYGGSIKYNVYRDQTSTLEFDGTLKNAQFSPPPALSFLSLLKHPKVAGTLRLNQGQPTHLSNLEIKEGNHIIQGNIDLKEGQLKALDIPKFVLGKNNFSSNITQDAQNKYIAQLKGKFLDLSHLFPFNISPAPEKAAGPQNAGTPLPVINMVLKMDNILLAHDVLFSDVNITGQLKENALTHGTLKANLYDKNYFKFSFQPVTKETTPPQKQLTLSTDNLGLILKAFDLSDKYRGGFFTLAGTQMGEGDSPLTGTIELNKLTALNAPVLATLLNATSFTGLGSLLKNKGIQFDEGKGSFTWHNGKATLHDVFIQNSSLGLSADGTLSLASPQLDLKGEITPALLLNQTIGHIPLIGSLLSGGDPEKGVFSFSYTITGDASDAQVNVNPLSALAPSSLKEGVKSKKGGETPPSP